MKRILLTLLSIFILQHVHAQCVYNSSTTVSAATFMACGTVTVTAGVKLTVTGNVALSGGQSLSVVNNGTIEVTGDFTATGNSDFIYSGTGNLKIDGNIDFSGHMQLNTTGTISVSGDAQFGGNSTVSGTGSIAVSGTSTVQGSGNVFGWTTSSGNTSCTGCTLSTGNPTPISLLYFSAEPNKNEVELKWASATESFNKYYTLERSRDGIRFEEFQQVNSKAPNGNSLTVLNYAAVDAKPLNGVSYYRLKQTDYDGNYKVFKVISVSIGATKNITFNVYPNPSHGQFTADFSGIENNHEVQIIMHDQLGRSVYSTTFYTQETSNSVDITPETKLSKGVYSCSLVVEGVKYTTKVLVD